MRDSDRFKLYFGPYTTPRFRYGQRVWCHYRGWVKIVGLTDGKIQWPIGRPITPKPGRDPMGIGAFGGLVIPASDGQRRVVSIERKADGLWECLSSL